ncbi:hypothetical protein Esi_0179_0028 [Ectocarpus siliculosus]|uniref:Uncharacterized protein n=1 Tax=Ectocarpus siliculosus TaxID=2880 RepID=D7FND4_ECTSI|nr:hypothetical protein Esi_0179_0028 [Ectocarpus siliculosus]|eukprot:CBJ30188.1 hypothetical protein Esi_0179_0028 [Ectocarpus siliculosus]
MAGVVSKAIHLCLSQDARRSFDSGVPSFVGEVRRKHLSVMKPESGVDRLVEGHYIHRRTDGGRESGIERGVAWGRVGREW